MLACPHCGATLNSDGTCPAKHSTAYKARTSLHCPLCGGKVHARETNTHAQSLDCLWRQYSKASGSATMLAVTTTEVRGFAAWLDSLPTMPPAGREDGLRALAADAQAKGYQLPPALAADAARYTPKSNGQAAPAPQAAPAEQASPSPAPVVEQAQPAPQAEPEQAQPPAVASLRDRLKAARQNLTR